MSLYTLEEIPKISPIKKEMKNELDKLSHLTDKELIEKIREQAEDMKHLKDHEVKPIPISFNTDPKKCKYQTVLCIDMDNTIVNTQKKLKELTLQNLDLAKFWDDEQKTQEVPHQLENFLIKDCMKREGFYENLEPYENAIQAVKLLSHYFIVRLLTAPLKGSKYCYQEKVNWATKRFGPQIERCMIFSSDKTLVNFDYILDDRKPVGLDFINLKRKWIIMDQSYNRQEECFHRLKTFLPSPEGLADLLLHIIVTEDKKVSDELRIRREILVKDVSQVFEEYVKERNKRENEYQQSLLETVEKLKKNLEDQKNSLQKSKEILDNQIQNLTESKKILENQKNSLQKSKKNLESRQVSEKELTFCSCCWD